jgi:hypothetical protein
VFCLFCNFIDSTSNLRKIEGLAIFFCLVFVPNDHSTYFSLPSKGDGMGKRSI